MTRKDPLIATEYASSTPFAYQLELRAALQPWLDEFPKGAHILDAGCGNGYLSGVLLEEGFSVVGVDASESGIRICHETYPKGQFHVASLNEPDLASLTGKDFDSIVAIEVIEHLPSPGLFLKNCHAVLKDSGRLILTTPYHGYLKNLALSLSGTLDDHFGAQKEGGHIKFWSRKTLTAELAEQGFEVVAFRGIGRLPWFWKSMALQTVKRS